MRNPFQVVLAAILGLLLLAVAIVAIREGSEIIARLGQHIMGLFRCANLNPGTRGFGCFIQLIIIAGFVGWAISRFKNVRRK